jgi:NAD(P)-dependent dehydrogenase (short-subunit alcohol dehydrogenase family)
MTDSKIENTSQANSGGRLAARKIVVTGGGSGIGQVTAQLFASEGAQVAVLDLNHEAAEKIARNIGGIAVQVDVAEESSVNAAIEQAGAALGGIDGVVNCAGIVTLGPIEETSLTTWRRHMDVNLTGTFLICRATLPWLRKAKNATIVNVSSAQALQPTSVAAAYAASKGGVLSLTKALAAELAPDIRANAVCPGLVDTPMHDALRSSPNDPPTVSLDKYPLKRWASAQEIASSILFLTSIESSYITGATLAVDGGRTFH